MKKLIALVLALVMVLAVAAAFADPSPVANTHNVVISNNDQNVSHTYEGYQVFKGNLNATQDTLSDIQWGDGIVPATLLTNLIAANAVSGGPLEGAFAGITASSTASEVAMKLSGWTSSTGLNQSAKKVDAFAAVVADSLSTTKITFTADSTGKNYKSSVKTDGYYFIKDVTTTLEGSNGSDTLSKYLIRITDDVDIVAKDTGSHSDKVIVESTGDQNDNNKNIGDTITYKSTVNPLPNPRKYNTFKLTMEDTLEKGLTFTGISSVTIGSDTLTFGTDYYFIVGGVTYDSALTSEDNTHKKAFTAPSAADAVGTTGSHTTNTTLRVIFKNAKAMIIGNAADDATPQYAGSTLTVNYTAVLNADAELAPESNDNSMKYKFSNNPNYDYDGDDWKQNEPFGETPEKTVETYTTALQIYKVDGSNQALAGATFTITATDVFNVVRETGDTFVADDTSAAEYWKLKDGSYTTTDPANVTDPDTQYYSTTQKYKKVSAANTIVSPDDSSNKVYTVTSGSDGIIRLEGIKAGTYTVTEVAAPDGYNGLKGTVNAVIDWSTVHGSAWAVSDKGRGGFVLTSSTGTDDFANAAFTMTSTGAVVSEITIQNHSGAVLPSTGGIGTTIFYILGGLLVVGAAVILVARRKASN